MCNVAKTARLVCSVSLDFDKLLLVLEGLKKTFLNRLNLSFCSEKDYLQVENI